MAVIVQEQVDGVAGTAYSRAPGDDGAVLVEPADGRGWALVGAEVTGSIAGLDEAALHGIAAAARRAEAVLAGPAD